eukprot:3641947-Karenia_brevis.AAC.1
MSVHMHTPARPLPRFGIPLRMALSKAANHRRVVLLRSYARIRQSVQKLRRDGDVTTFRKRLGKPTVADFHVLQKVLKTRERVGAQKLWGNIRKVDDRL